jgi:hypothetical protein
MLAFYRIDPPKMLFVYIRMNTSTLVKAQMNHSFFYFSPSTAFSRKIIGHEIILGRALSFICDSFTYTAQLLLSSAVFFDMLTGLPDGIHRHLRTKNRNLGV